MKYGSRSMQARCRPLDTRLISSHRPRRCNQRSTLTLCQHVTHCKGRVRYWQCENEPTNPILWEGTATDYANHLKVFSQAVKAADPDAVVVIAGAVDAFHTSVEAQNPDAQAKQDFFDHLLRESAANFDV